MPAPEFAILGPLEVRRDGGLVDVRGGLPRALLLVLLVHANERVASERLIDELWGERPPADAANALQVHVSRVRRALGAADALVTVAGGYRLRVDPGALDAALFEAELEAARVALAAGMAREAEATLNQALARWRGPALADCTYHAFAQGEIARLEELRLAALEELMEAQLAQDRRPVAELEQLVAEHPLRERLRGQLMVALHRNGRQADALAAYRRGRDALMAELGLEPSPALRRLELDVLRHAPPPPRRSPPAARPLLGREAELHTLRAELARGGPRVIVVRGDAGIGKTRLLAELAAGARGWSVLRGRADEGNPVPYQPVVEALRGAPLATLDGLEPELAALAAVAPELRPGAHAGEAPPLCAALSALVGALARAGPTLLVLDDLQWADRATLQLLRHLVRAAPVTILAALREPGPDATAWIGELHLERLVAEVRLGGLDEASARALTGGTPELCRVTGGNPFLLEELARGPALPESVRAVFERRLVRLDGAVRAVLGAAAAIGPEFAPGRVAGDAVPDALEAAAAARLIEAVPGREPRYRFVPPLLRDVLRAA